MPESNRLTQEEIRLQEDRERKAYWRRWFGQNSIRNAVARFAQTNCQVKFSIRRILIDGNVAAIERSRENEEQTSDLPSSEDFIVVDFRNGQISRWREYLDAKNWLKVMK
jgi:limonene-1,2-epoxide hydrolase